MKWLRFIVANIYRELTCGMSQSVPSVGILVFICGAMMAANISRPYIGHLSFYIVAGIVIQVSLEVFIVGILYLGYL